MKTVKYETSAGALVALLDTRSFAFADLYTITLAGGGTSLRFTTADTDIGYGGDVWTHAGPLIDQKSSRATAHWKIGLDTDTWQFTVAPRAVDPISGAAYPDKIGSVPWLAALQGGALDGAVVLVDRAFVAAWPDFPRSPVVAPTGVVNIFTGRVATVDLGRTTAVISVNSHLELLDQQMPINVYQAGCRHTLFDAGCQLAASSFAVSGTAAAGSMPRVIVSNIGAPSGSGTFTLGSLVMTSGLNAGFARSIRSWSPSTGGASGSIILLSAFPYAVAAGDTFTAYPGCDKQLATCGLFGNTANFGGQPYIPPPETAT